MQNPQNIGKLGENIACTYLLKKQWKVLFRNYREKHDEIDIIAITSDETLVFCEVKTRLIIGSPNSGLQPEDNLTFKKLTRITRACRLFVAKHAQFIKEEKGWRIDLLAIDVGINNTTKTIRHYENI